MKILTVAGAKGGVGKTTTALTLAAELAARGVRVALRDLDPQASATLALGQAPVGDPLGASPVRVHGFDLYRGGRGLAVDVPADRTTFAIPDDHPERGRFPELLILDTPPALGALTLAALRDADRVLVTLTPSPLDLPALADVAAVLGDGGRSKLRAVFTRVHARRVLNTDVAAHIEQTHPGTLYGVQIPEDVRAAEAPGHGSPVTLYAPGSRAAEAYRQLAAEVATDLHTRAN